jgi:hypothetical protein
LVVAQSSSEIPEGLMNNPVYMPKFPCRGSDQSLHSHYKTLVGVRLGDGGRKCFFFTFSVPCAVIQ